MNIKKIKRVCIVGWGVSGISLCELLLSLKKEVKVTEAKERNCFLPSSIEGFSKKGVQFEFGCHSENFIKDSQLLIVSPGVNTSSSPAIKIADIHNIPYMGEIEFSFRLTKARIVAITGTNGKTTTSYLTYEVLKQTGKRVFLGGNIGTPFSSFVLDAKEEDIIVLELSSFQLETVREFRPYLAVFLNIEPDHLDRYSSLKDYLGAKMNLFKNQQRQDWALLNKNINFRGLIERKINSEIVYFSNESNNENYSCVYKISEIFGLGGSHCARVFSSFTGLPHRGRLVGIIDGISFINDSKATNPCSTIWALKNIDAPILLIAGGKDKGLDYSSIIPYLKQVKKINLLGEASSKIGESLKLKVKSECFSSLEEAVVSSFKEAEPGYTVLFSPMCASYDMFVNYEDRGNQFEKIVTNLSGPKGCLINSRV